MSHWTEIKTQIRDTQALERAALELGLTMSKGTQARGYYDKIAADYVIQCDGPYDIACVKQSDGTYTLKTDWYSGHVAKQVGEGFRRLIQLYGVQKAIAEAKKKGLQVYRSTLSNGSIKLVMAGASL